jgi:beta-N-acetylhexosaminidase
MCRTKRFRSASLLLALVVVAALALTACGPSTPSGAPSITGVIRQLTVTATGATLLVTGAGDIDKASVTVGADTRILRTKDGRATTIPVTELQAGMNVEIWFDGPVAESYPVQAHAGTVNITSQ